MCVVYAEELAVRELAVQQREVRLLQVYAREYKDAHILICLCLSYISMDANSVLHTECCRSKSSVERTTFYLYVLQDAVRHVTVYVVSSDDELEAELEGAELAVAAGGVISTCSLL